MTIFIGNLSWDTEVEDLESLFSNYGVVKKCFLPLDRETGRKRGFAFVDLNDHSSEKIAIDDLQDVEWMGRDIRVNEGERKKSHKRHIHGLTQNLHHPKKKRKKRIVRKVIDIIRILLMYCRYNISYHQNESKSPLTYFKRS